MGDPASVGQMVNRAARLLRRLADKRMAPLGLTSGYLPVLTALMPGVALSQKTLTEQAGIEQPTMAATLGRMERDGVIKRQPDPGDRRSSLFSLTPATRQKMVTIAAVVEGINEDVLTSFATADRLRLYEMLAQMIAAVEKALGGQDERQ